MLEICIISVAIVVGQPFTAPDRDVGKGGDRTPTMDHLARVRKGTPTRHYQEYCEWHGQVGEYFLPQVRTPESLGRGVLPFVQSGVV